jgi:hypothetical protein
MGRFSRLHCWICVVLLLVAQPVTAQDRITPDMVKMALQDQGYVIESTTRTLLGRVRFVASNGAIWREIVLDSSSGQILRDYAVEFSPAQIPDPDEGDMPRGGELLPLTSELQTSDQE